MPRCSVLRSFARLIPGCIYDKVTFDPKIGGEFIFEDGSINSGSACILHPSNTD